MSHNEMVTIIELYLNNTGISLTQLAKRLNISKARVSQILKGEYTSLTHIRSHISKMAQMFSTHLLINKETPEEIENKIIQAFYQKRHLSDSEKKEKLIELFTSFGEEGDRDIYKKFESFIKETLPEYFQNKQERKELEEFFGWYAVYQLVNFHDGKKEELVITKRILKICEDNSQIKIFLSAPKHNYTYKDGKVKKVTKTNALYIDIEEEGGAEKTRYLISPSSENRPVLTGLGMFYSPHAKTHTAKMVAFVRLNKNPTDDELSALPIYSKQEFLNLTTDPENIDFKIIYTFLTSSRNHILELKQYNQFIEVNNE